jgi:hypothetical protein
VSVREFGVTEELPDIFTSLAAIPVTVSHTVGARAETDVPYHPSYKGTVLFQNVFHGQLPATDYPKVNVGFYLLFRTMIYHSLQFYFAMFLVYVIIGGVWAWFCFRHLHDLLPIQVSHKCSLWNISKYTL